MICFRESNTLGWSTFLIKSGVSEKTLVFCSPSDTSSLNKGWVNLYGLVIRVILKDFIASSLKSTLMVSLTVLFASMWFLFQKP